MIEFFNRAIAPLKRRVQLMVSRCIITALNDSDKVQILQATLFADEPSDKVERFAEFGFSSNPPKGSEAVVVSVGGSRAHGIIVATNDRASRFKNLAEGETVIYTNDGTHVHLKKSGTVEIKTSALVKVDAPEAEFTGNVSIAGNLTVGGNADITGNTTVGGNADVTGNTNVGGNVISGGNVAAAALVSGASFSGPAGAPMSASVDINTSGNISGGGTDLATVKSTFNSHQHSSPAGGNTGGPTSTL